MATQKGASNTESETGSTENLSADGKKSGERTVSERDALIAKMATQVSQRHREEEDTARQDGSQDARMAAEARGEGEDVVVDRDTESNGDQGTEDPTGDTEVAGDDSAADPLAGFVVMVDGKPRLKLKVNGTEQLVDVETARASLQKGVSAEMRLQQAAELGKQLRARELAVQAQEAALRAQSKQSQPSPDADDSALEEEATSLANTLLTAPASEVAASLKKVLSRVRQAPPSIDEDAIADRVAAKNATRSREQDTQKGFAQFEKDFADIAGDPQLFAVADSMTDTIAAEHQDWSPSQIMLEAGRKTREWRDKFAKPAAPPSQESSRQQRKDNLRPMPQARSARRDAGSKEAQPQTPRDVLLEIRKSRGQGV